MIAPCRHCTERVQGCHGSCEKYKAFRAQCDEIRVKQLKKRDINSYIINGYTQRKDRAVKKRRK